MVRSIILLVGMVISFSSFSQCKPEKIETDSCGLLVVLTIDDFTEFYVAKRTLEEVSKEHPKFKKLLKKAEKSLKKEKETHQLEIKATKKTLEELKRLIAKIEIDNLKEENRLNSELKSKKKSNFNLLMLNIAQGAVLLITFTLIIAK